VRGDSNRVHHQRVTFKMSNRLAVPTRRQVLRMPPVEIYGPRLLLLAAEKHGDFRRTLQDLYARFAEYVGNALGIAKRMRRRECAAAGGYRVVAVQRINDPRHQVFVAVTIGDVAPFHIGLRIAVGVLAPDTVEIRHAGGAKWPGVQRYAQRNHTRNCDQRSHVRPLSIIEPQRSMMPNPPSLNRSAVDRLRLAHTCRGAKPTLRNPPYRRSVRCTRTENCFLRMRLPAASPVCAGAASSPATGD